MPDTAVRRSAAISACGSYRYQLIRSWDDGKPNLVVIGLNPSTADGEVDDPTMRRVMRFATDGGFGSLCMLNLFAYRATHPRELRLVDDPIGPDNDSWILRSPTSDPVLCAWGAGGTFMGRDLMVRWLLRGRRLLNLGLTKNGQPRHPLYLKSTELMQLWEASDA